MLLFSQQTAALETLLLDHGYITDVMTPADGPEAAKHQAPSALSRNGVLGGGVQARMQLEHLLPVVECRQILVWMRDAQKQDGYREHFADSDLDLEFASSPEEVAAACNLIVTTTAAKEPLLRAEWIRPGTHITAMGSDTLEKIELDPLILAQADRVVVDSLPQSETRGEISQAVNAGVLERHTAVEIGAVIAGTVPGRQSDAQTTVCDLTGVAVQDLMIAQGVVEGLS